LFRNKHQQPVDPQRHSTGRRHAFQGLEKSLIDFVGLLSQCDSLCRAFFESSALLNRVG
jgi:hypothetical protein